MLSGWYPKGVGQSWSRTARMLHRQVVRHGKGIFVFALTRRCLPVFALFHEPWRHARSLNSKSSSSRSEADANLSAVNNTDTCSSLSDGEELKATPTRRIKTPFTESLDSSNSTSTTSNSTSSESEAGVVRGKKGLRRSVKEFVSQFTKGTKVLWVDFKASRQASARKKAGEALTFQEDRKLRQVRSIWRILLVWMFQRTE